MASGSISSKMVPLYSIFSPGDLFELGGKLGDAFSSVRFHEADDHVFSAASPPDGFAQHAVRLAHARGIAEKQLQDSLGPLLGGDFFQPLLPVSLSLQIFSFIPPKKC